MKPRGRTHRTKRAWILTAALGAMGLVVLAGCALFFPNRPPVARITADVLSGASPLVVTLSALDSFDPDDDPDNPNDNSIVSYSWDFGDGTSDTGLTVQHVFSTTSGTEKFTVTLRVTDKEGARGEITQTIEVRGAADGDGVGTGFPTARFTYTPFIGISPLVVSFDALGSTPGAGSIVAYNWDFGDGEERTGSRPSHTFTADATTEYTVTLFVWNDQDEVDAQQETVIVIVPGEDTGDDPPIAELTVSDPELLFLSTDPPNIPSLFEVNFDPRGSSADAGHQIEYFAWDFGDGESHVETTDLEITHIYELRGPTHTYVASLTVFDDQGEQASVIVNITVTEED